MTTRGVLRTAQELFAEAAGAKQALFSTNGSSMSVRVAITAVAGTGQTLVIARNAHKSTFIGLIQSGARPVWLDPAWDEELEIAFMPLPQTLASALDAHPEARGVMVTTPSTTAPAPTCAGRDLP